MKYFFLFIAMHILLPLTTSLTVSLTAPIVPHPTPLRSQTPTTMCEVLPTIDEMSPSPDGGDNSKLEHLMMSMLEERDRLMEKLRESQERYSEATRRLAEVEGDNEVLMRQLQVFMPEVGEEVGGEGRGGREEGREEGGGGGREGGKGREGGRGGGGREGGREGGGHEEAGRGGGRQ